MHAHHARFPDSCEILGPDPVIAIAYGALPRDLGKRIPSARLSGSHAGHPPAADRSRTVHGFFAGILGLAWALLGN